MAWGIFPIKESLTKKDSSPHGSEKEIDLYGYDVEDKGLSDAWVWVGSDECVQVAWADHYHYDQVHVWGEIIADAWVIVVGFDSDEHCIYGDDY